MHTRRVSVIGLGYVGLPVACAFGQSQSVIGFDINKKRIQELRDHEDRTNEVTSELLKSSDIVFTDDIEELKKADFHIVAVPTPINDARQPDLTPLEKSSHTVGKALKTGDIVVYESTVYPGATEEVCIPILESVSGLKFGRDFTVGYSPERINPGDKEHTFTKILKVVSGSDADTLEIVANVYGSVVEAGVHRAPTIKVAEAAKVIENTQRDLNIALMNELSVIFAKMDIDTQAVLAAAGTKWNFLKFQPGLVGGHCIGVDPYYLTYKAEQLGYRPEVIQAGRRINDSMGKFVVEQTVKQLILHDRPVKGAKVAIMGLTFKEDCPDLRNSRVIDLIEEFRAYGIEPMVHDPLACPDEAHEEYGVDLTPFEKLQNLDVMVLAVGHAEYRARSVDDWAAILAPGGMVTDVKAALPVEAFAAKNIPLWRL